MEAVERCGWRPLKQAQLAFRWLEEVARSPPGLELVSDDEASFSGVFLVLRGRAMYQLAVRHPQRHRNDGRYDVRRHPGVFGGYPDLDDDEPYGR